MECTAEGGVDGTRLQIPARFRETWGVGPLVVSKGLNSCLYVHTVAGFGRLVATLLTEADSRARVLRRFFMSGALELVPDARGRLRIGQHLMQYAGIQDRVVWRAQGVCLEVWDKGAFDSWVASGDRSSTLREFVFAVEAAKETQL